MKTLVRRGEEGCQQKPPSSGNIGTGLMINILRNSELLKLVAMVGIYSESDGLACARRLGIPTTHEGIEGFLRMPQFAYLEIHHRLCLRAISFSST